MSNVTAIYNISQFSLLIEVTLLVIIAAVGLFGNVLIILCVCVIGNTKDFTLPFVVHLAIANLLMSCWVVPGTILLTVLPAERVSKHLCTAYGMSIFVTSSALVNFSTIIALNRYIIILKHNLIKRFLVANSCTFWCILVWIYTISQVVLPTIMDLFRYKYNPVMRACHLDYTHLTIGVAFYVNCVCFAPCVLICTICYSRILSALYRSRRRMNRHTRQQLEMHGQQLTNAISMTISDAAAVRRTTRERKATIPLFAALIAFILHWMPIMVVVALDSSFTLLHEKVYRSLAIFSLASICDNWIIYGALNRNFANGYKHVLCLCKTNVAENNNNVVDLDVANVGLMASRHDASAERLFQDDKLELRNDGKNDQKEEEI